MRLAAQVIPQVFRNALSFELRFWVAGCSTGEEAFTLGMLLLEHLDTLPNRERWTIRIFATDMDLHALDYARAGRYPALAASEIPPELRNRYFTEYRSNAAAGGVLHHARPTPHTCRRHAAARNVPFGPRLADGAAARRVHARARVPSSPAQARWRRCRRCAT